MNEKKSKWTLFKAIEMIERNKGKVKDKKITYNKAGIKVLGAIDYLINYHGYKRGE